VVVGFVAAAAVLTGCGGTTEAASADGAWRNDADIEFVQSMIPHHEQALMMAAMADQAAQDQRIRDLAEGISTSQAAEIELMRSWLAAWGVEEADAAGHAAMGHGLDGSGMPGMMTGDQLTALVKSEASRFDRMFLAMMIDHHEGAIEMARTVQDEGDNAEVAALADGIIEAQAREIADMRDWLAAT
jgi:uncharacterized protein (DUF305 family)